MNQCCGNVLANGNLLCYSTGEMSDLRPIDLDMLCQKLTASASVQNAMKFDWCYQGGRPMILYLGDYAQAIDICCKQSPMIAAVLPKTVQHNMSTVGQPLSFVPQDF